MRTGRPPTPLSERFNAKVSRGHVRDACDLWTGTAEPGGYGSVWANGRNISAHRVAWELANGRPVPNGMVVRHSCHVRHCVNPRHLSIGTHADNVQDMYDAGRENSALGERNGSAKLSDEDVEAIRRLYSQGEVLQREIGELYGVAQSQISRLVNMKTWAHVGAESE